MVGNRKEIFLDEHQDTDADTSNEDPAKTDDTKVKYPRKISTKIFIHRGIFLILLAVSLFALWSTLAKMLTLTVNPIQVLAMTTPFATVGSTALCIYRGIKPPKGAKCYLLLLASGIAVIAKNLAHFWAFNYILLADVITINQLQVVVVGLLSCICLRERLGIFDAVFGIIAILGVAVIARPTFIFGQNQNPPPNYNPLIGILLSLITAVTAAVFVVVVRKQTILGVHPYFCSAFNTAISSVVSTIICFALGYWKCPTSSEMLLSSAIGSIYFVAQVMFYVGLSLESATTISILSTFKIVAGFIWQFVFFLLLPTWTSACGAALVMFACIGTIQQRSKKTQREETVDGDVREHAVNEDEGLVAAAAQNEVETPL